MSATKPASKDKVDAAKKKSENSLAATLERLRKQEEKKYKQKTQTSVGDSSEEFQPQNETPEKLTIFYEPPPGLFKQQQEEKPEDCIPDKPENQKAREFLAKAPTKGLWMPLGQEVKLMQCWRCKAYGHRAGDRECPLFQAGNIQIEKARKVIEDPMTEYIREQEQTKQQKAKEKQDRLTQLQELLADTESKYKKSAAPEGDITSKHKKHKHKHHKHHHKKHHKASSSSSSSSSGTSDIDKKQPPKSDKAPEENIEPLAKKPRLS